MGALTPHPGPLPVEGRGRARWTLPEQPSDACAIDGPWLGEAEATARRWRFEINETPLTVPLSPQRGEGRGEG